MMNELLYQELMRVEMDANRFGVDIDIWDLDIEGLIRLFEDLGYIS